MKTVDIRVMTQDQRRGQLAALKKEQFNLRFQKAAGQMENTARFREIRRDIARVKSIDREERVKSAGNLQPKASGPAAKDHDTQESKD